MGPALPGGVQRQTILMLLESEYLHIKLERFWGDWAFPVVLQRSHTACECSDKRNVMILIILGHNAVRQLKLSFLPCVPSAEDMPRHETPEILARDTFPRSFVQAPTCLSNMR